MPRKKVETPTATPVDPQADLNKIFIPLTTLRMYIAELEKDGVKKAPLGHLLVEIHRIYKEDQNA